MKIFTVAQIREWDQYTIQHEPISSLHLMERASESFVRWYCARFDDRHCVHVFCGMGNNGGDGLAVARLLIQKCYNVKVYVVKHSPQGSADFQTNLERLKSITSIAWIETEHQIPHLSSSDIVIDALLGSGVSRPVDSGILADVIAQINRNSSIVVSIDIASGLFADKSTPSLSVIIQPTYTVTFQSPKLAFFLPQCADYVGKWEVIDIGLSSDFENQTQTSYYCITSQKIASLIRKREKFVHKGTFGHALLIGGSYGKIGAVVLSAKACMRSGVGLLTVQLPRCGYDILQTSLPEAMVLPDWHWSVNTTMTEVEPYSAIGIGPGLGKDPLTLRFLRQLLPSIKLPAVFDADALNLLAENSSLLDLLPANSILTPHPKEFERLIGKKWADDFEKLVLLQNFSQKYQVIVCLKGAHTAIALPEGRIWFNTTGNPGMATAGSGDVLTGIITGLLAQGFTPENAALFGVYQHGMAGDRAAAHCTQPALIASDIINHMGW
ncbi:MAG: NAD(P)H-hydrate dehydratase [Runella sp.]